jgi:hypothetical protein
LTAARVFSAQNLLRIFVLYFDDTYAVRFGAIRIVGATTGGINQLRFATGASATHASASIYLRHGGM